MADKEEKALEALLSSGGFGAFDVRRMDCASKKYSKFKINVIRKKNDTFVTKYWKELGCKENVLYMENWNRYLKEFENCDWAVKRIKTCDLPFVPLYNLTCLVDAGKSLDFIDISGNQGRKFAKLVKTWIWDMALTELKARKLSHQDINERHIIISPSHDKAVLTGFTMTKPFSTPPTVDHSPTLLGDFLSATKDVNKVDAEFDEICTAVVLHCLWSCFVSCFNDPAADENDLDNVGRWVVKKRYKNQDQREALIRDIELETQAH